MLRWRLLIGSALIVALVALAGWEHRQQPPGVWVTLPLLLAIGLLVSQEFIALARAAGHDTWGGVVYAGNTLLLVANWLAMPWGWDNSWGRFGPPAMVLAGAVGLAFAVEMLRYQGPGRSLGRVAMTMFALVYVGVLLSFVAQLRLVAGGAQGIPAIASLLIVVKMSDTGAYTVGRLCGGKFFRRKLAPTLSPGKTIEGALGGLLFACAGAGLAFVWLVPAMVDTAAVPVAVWRWLVFGLAVGLAGMVGDLAESMLKRDAGKKDSSTWLPGFGGVLDLLDSILFAAPVAYLLWASGFVGP